MALNIDRIVNVQIALNTAGVSQRNFDKILMAAEFEGSARVTEIVSADALLEAPYSFETTDRPYICAQQMFAQTPGPTSIFVGRLDPDDATITDSMAAIMAENPYAWYGVVDGDHDETRVVTLAAWIEANKKLFGAAVTLAGQAQNITSDTASQLKASTYMRTYPFHVTDLAAQFPEAALMAKKFADLPGTENWADVTLAGVPAVNISETEATNIEFRNCNYFTFFRDLAVTRNGVVSGKEFIDNIRGRDWLEETMKVNVYNRKINRKIAYTDAGIAIIEQAMIEALALGQRRGFIAPDVPNTEGTGIIPGYVTTVPRAAQIITADKRQRVLRDIGFTATLANAINTVEIRGSLILESLPAA